MARQRKRKGDPVHGWLNIDKPVEITSTKVVAIVKRLYNAQKVGHGGTLDPLADGILPIALGEATKTSAYAMDADKEYRFSICWGSSTTTQDREGEVTGTSDVRPGRDDIEAVLGQFIGDIEQVPPKYSAIKVDGERAYDLARDGEAFELKSRPAFVYSLVLEDQPDADRAVFHVRCGKGFYVRALVRDIASALGAEGHCSALRRLRVGQFAQDVSISLEKLEQIEHKAELMGLLMPIETALDDIPAIQIDREDTVKLRQGRTIVLLPHIVEDWRSQRSALQGEDVDGDRLALAMDGDEAIALGEVRAGRFQPSRVFQQSGAKAA